MRYERMVEWADVDYAGISHYARTFVWVDEAFKRWCMRHGLTHQRLRDSGLSWPFVAIGCNYRRPVTLEEQIVIELRLNDLSPRGVTVEFQVFRADGELAMSGFQKRRFIDRAGFRGTDAPPDVMRMLEAMQAGHDVLRSEITAG
jgi:YbgC/YbaW family acyl-CoA thioester hydrolase